MPGIPARPRALDLLPPSDELKDYLAEKDGVWDPLRDLPRVAFATIPKKARAPMARVFERILRTVLDNPEDKKAWEVKMGWTRFVLAKVSGGRERPGQSERGQQKQGADKTIAARLQALVEDPIGCLAKCRQREIKRRAAREEARVLERVCDFGATVGDKEEKDKEEASRRGRRAERLARQGQFKKAMRIMQEGRIADGTDPDVLQELRRLHPRCVSNENEEEDEENESEDEEDENESEDEEDENNQNSKQKKKEKKKYQDKNKKAGKAGGGGGTIPVNAMSLAHAIASFDKSVCAGPSGLSMAHLATMFAQEEASQLIGLLVDFVERDLRGDFPGFAYAEHGGATLIPLIKDGRELNTLRGALRPIAAGETLAKITDKLCNEHCMARSRSEGGAGRQGQGGGGGGGTGGEGRARGGGVGEEGEGWERGGRVGGGWWIGG